MDSNAIQRLSRLKRECDIAIGPALLLAAASAVLVFVLGLGALLEESTPAKAAGPSQRTAPPTHGGEEPRKTRGRVGRERSLVSFVPDCHGSAA